MTLASLSSAYLSTALLPSVRQAQSQLANLEIESSTGQYANLGLQLGSQSGYELSLRSQDDLLQAMTTANAITASNLSDSQTALSTLQSAAQTAAQNLVQTATQTTSPSTLQSIGQSNLQQLISLANSGGAGGYVFGGQNTRQAPLDDYYAQPTSAAKSAVDSAFNSYFGFSPNSPQAANITSSQLQGFLHGPFAAQFSSPNWGSNWSTASDDNTSAEISPGSVINTSTNANSVGFQQLAQGYSMLSEFGDIGLSASAQETLVSAATGSINQGVSSLIGAQAQLGQAQSQVTQANSDMSAQMTTLQTTLNKMDGVDPATVATELTTLSTQLETAYQITAKIANLNLAQYLPT